MSRLIIEKLQEISEDLSKKMDALLPKPDNLKEDKLFEAMRYSTLSGGKRLRAFLVIVSSEVFVVDREYALQTAAAIEFIQSYSLIHDDLPSIDDDDIRRGIPSCHKAFDEATAILAGDTLLTYAFEVLSSPLTHHDPKVRLELISTISKAIGFAGMAGGQMIDILSHFQKLEYSEIVRLQRMKTGTFFTASCEAGAILAKAPKNLRYALKAYASDMGIAFQIMNDIMDVQGSTEQTGKNNQRDQELGKATLVDILGPDQAMSHVQMLGHQAVEHLSVFGKKAKTLIEFSEYLLSEK